MLNAKEVKNYAIECGADLVGIGDINRFEGFQKEKDPRYIFPEAKVIIGLGFRILRGSLRGIEEGTQFYQYSTMGVENINEVYAPIVLQKVSRLLEDNGYEGVIQRYIGDRRRSSDSGTNPEITPTFKIPYSEPVSPDKPAPDVQIDFNLGAYICGLGEVGYCGLVLSPEFGPMQRFAFILTDAPLELDPLYESPKLCDRCMKCVEECPGKAISRTKKLKMEIDGHELEWGELDEWQCAAYYMGAKKQTNPFLMRDAFKDLPDADRIISGKKRLSSQEVLQVVEILNKYYPRVTNNYNPAICGGRGCIRACMIHLEQQGKLKNKFKTPFRKRKPWKL